MKKETKAIHTPFQKRDAYGALSFPVYNTVAYEFDSAHAMTEAFAGRVPEPDYSRVMNPTVTYFENRVKALSDAENVFALTTGMAAIFHTLLVFAEAGKTIVMSNHLFGNTFSLITTTLARLGVKAQIADFSDLDLLDKTMADDACLIFAEYITNPQLEMVDIKKLSEIAHKRSLPLIVDTTAIPFTEVDARELGIDVEVLSSTKYISGGATSLGGLILDYGTFPEVKKRMSMEFLFNIGSYMTPQVAYMQTIGLETLKVRYDKQAQNALDLARLLQQVPQVSNSRNPSAPCSPSISRLSRSVTVSSTACASSAGLQICLTASRWQYILTPRFSSTSLLRKRRRWMCSTQPSVSLWVWKMSTTSMRILCRRLDNK